MGVGGRGRVGLGRAGVLQLGVARPDLLHATDHVAVGDAGRQRDPIAGVAGRHGVSSAQIALAWLLAQGENIVPIPGVKRSETLRDSARAPEVTLSSEDLAAIEAAAPSGKTAGPRYAKAGMARVKL